MTGEVKADRRVDVKAQQRLVALFHRVGGAQAVAAAGQDDVVEIFQLFHCENGLAFILDFIMNKADHGGKADDFFV